MAATLPRYRRKSVMGDAYSGDQTISTSHAITVRDNYVYINNVNTGINVKGDPGKSAYQIARQNGFNGTIEEWLASLHGETGPQGEKGETGAQGATGKSAYQVALNNGFVGTEEEWLASLHGKDGVITVTEEQDIHGGIIKHINFDTE